ncbi:hypothetical protein [Flagellimonas sp. S3867]|uniref:hypothetical protein n=1 Tax=Flagellimonas sp. S3867 TaxID=2768063 RepID=UPI0016854B19|nr:hypothetical protein [Flagellimonas sp. S3867]
MVKIYGFNIIPILPFLFAIQIVKSQAVNIPCLDRQLALSDKNSVLIRKKKKLFYWNIETNQRLFSKGFKIAYPFFDKAALVQEDGKYGVIDRNGRFIIDARYETFELAPFPHEAHIVIFNDLTINLKTGQKTTRYLRDEEPAPPKIRTPQDQKGEKWLRKSDHIKAFMQFEKIVAIGIDFVIVSNKGKIGITDIAGNALSEQDYEAVRFTEKYPHGIHSIIGLKNEKIWHYFRNGEKLLESSFACVRFDVELPNAIGVFQKKKHYKVLFTDGSVSEKRYDAISQNAFVAQRKNKIYLLKSDGQEQLFYRN